MKERALFRRKTYHKWEEREAGRSGGCLGGPLFQQCVCVCGVCACVLEYISISS